MLEKEPINQIDIEGTGKSPDAFQRAMFRHNQINRLPVFNRLLGTTSRAVLKELLDEGRTITAEDMSVKLEENFGIINKPNSVRAQISILKAKGYLILTPRDGIEGFNIYYGPLDEIEAMDYFRNPWLEIPKK